MGILLSSERMGGPPLFSLSRCFYQCVACSFFSWVDSALGALLLFVQPSALAESIFRATKCTVAFFLSSSQSVNNRLSVSNRLFMMVIGIGSK